MDETHTRINNLDETVRTSIENQLKSDEAISARVTSLEEGTEEVRSEIEAIKSDYIKKDEILDVVSDKTR